MFDKIIFRNKTQKNERELNGGIKAESTNSSIDTVDQIRDQLKEKYGWMSPSEYYSSSTSISDSSTDAEQSTKVKLSDIEGEMKISNYEVSNTASRDSVPNYFWIDSLCNWCYFEYSENTDAFRKEENRFGKYGNAWLNIITIGILGAIDAVQNGSWWEFFTDWMPGLLSSLFQFVGGIAQLADYGTSAIMSAESYIWKKIGVGTFGQSVISLTTGAPLDLAYILYGAGIYYNGADLFDRTKKWSIPTMLLGWCKIAWDTTSGVCDANVYIEVLATGDDKCDMPRSCVSLYMWNGYKKNWMPVKNTVETYDTYCKRANLSMVSDILESSYDLMKDQKEFVNILSTFSIMSSMPDQSYNNLYSQAQNVYTTYYGSNKSLFITSLSNIIYDNPYAVTIVGRLAFMWVYGIDPACFSCFQGRSPLSKLQALRVDNGDSSTWASTHWLEQQSFWIPLPYDSAKVKIYEDDTFQLINRPFSIEDWNSRDLLGYIHKNIAHPCFMRGNDDVLWISYWNRWTATRSKKYSQGSVFKKIIKVDGVQDIFKADLDNWDRIVASMFEKHDEYGFEDWLINCNYGLYDHKMTLSEEYTSEVKSYEESTISPHKTSPTVHIDKPEKKVITLTLSSSTEIDRDDNNGIGSVATKWR